MPNENHSEQPPWNPGGSEPESFLDMLYAPMDTYPPRHYPNENVPPPMHAPNYPAQPPLAPAPPPHDPRFMQYRDPRAGAPTGKHRLALQTDARAYHLNANPGNSTAVGAAYGYDGQRQMCFNTNPAGRSRVEATFPSHTAPRPPSVNAPGMQLPGQDWQAYTGVLDLRTPLGAPMSGEQLERSTGQKRRSREGREVSEEPDGMDDENTTKRKRKKKAPAAPKKRTQAKHKKAENKGKGRARGAGSKSGNLHRRSPGASDDEVDGLSAAVKHAAEPRLSQRELKQQAEIEMVGDGSSGDDEEAEDRGREDGDGSMEDESSEDDELKEKWGLNDAEKLQVVEFLTTPERYEQIRTSLAKYCIEMAQRLFKDSVQASQIRNYWNNNAFAKYKAVRAQLSHTGGGDPDAIRSEPPTSPTQSGSSRSRKASDVTFTATRTFSGDILLAFYNSKIYDLIHTVAHRDSAVERSRKINSYDPVSDAGKHHRSRLSESPEKNDGVDSTFLQQAFRAIGERSKRAQEIERERLELARRREEREEAERLERQEIRREQQKRAQDEAREVQWTRAVKMSESPIEMVRVRGLRLMDKLELEAEGSA